LLRIGLLWSDLAAHDASHAIPLQKFAALVYGRAQYICLQLDVPAADLPVLEQHGEIMRVADQLDDLSNAAALIASLDLVIAADSRIAHLACAMGKPVWLMLAFRPSWRWMLERSDSPWYPSVKLFRQPAADDWDSVVTRVARELDKWRA
jgi:ADP-heptose:LPS heptosyltransferase